MTEQHVAAPVGDVYVLGCAGPLLSLQPLVLEMIGTHTYPGVNLDCTQQGRAGSPEMTRQPTVNVGRGFYYCTDLLCNLLYRRKTADRCSDRHDDGGRWRRLSLSQLHTVSSNGRRSSKYYHKCASSDHSVIRSTSMEKSPMYHHSSTIFIIEPRGPARPPRVASGCGSTPLIAHTKLKSGRGEVKRSGRLAWAGK